MFIYLKKYVLFRSLNESNSIKSNAWISLAGFTKTSFCDTSFDCLRQNSSIFNLQPCSVIGYCSTRTSKSTITLCTQSMFQHRNMDKTLCFYSVYGNKRQGLRNIVKVVVYCNKHDVCHCVYFAKHWKGSQWL